MIKRRDREHCAGSDRVQPGEVHEDIPLILYVSNPAKLLLGRVWHLEVITANRRNQAQLVVRSLIEDERSKPAESGRLVINHPTARGLQPQVGSITRETSIVSKPLSVIAEADLVIGIVEAAIARDQFSLPVALEPGTRHHVEDAVGAIAVFRVVSATLHFQVVDILRIELRPNIRGDIGIRHWHTIKQPNLVPAANVQLVVHDVGAGSVVSDARETIGSVSPRG